MTVIDTLTQRNEAFADSRFSADLKIMPSMKTMIIGCVDPRVDPADIFGLVPGEVAVIRNVSRELRSLGYRVTATDAVAALVEASRQANSADEFAIADGKDLPFTDGRFDLVMAYNVLIRLGSSGWISVFCFI